ncbi:XapX domain-containing protein [Paracoccus aestuariivivens]|uniref:DUF1427 family protein n=1 Tax=Paracoccus aestuariivivens TaxID=1820333 RepID=A0A6L6JGA3_9RHOB|nr:XapX domain-containing protein [Paracoccus aestuariivivens]MTH79144.1 DUF1427 family protein [Paracoccus aestuariivivens]
MKIYVLSLAAGLLVGAIYGLLNIRSPAPPVVALVGLLGILIGEQSVPLLRQFMSAERLTMSWISRQCGPHVFGQLPTGGQDQASLRGPGNAAGQDHAG